MKCPYCKKPLKQGEMKEYETLIDHVGNPNAESYPPRPTFVCDCMMSQFQFWDEYGDVYQSEFVSEFRPKCAKESRREKFEHKMELADKIRPLCFWAKYPYDTANQIAHFIVGDWK